MFRTAKTEAAIRAEEAGRGVYSIDWDTAEERIRACKAIVTDTNQQMDPERLMFLKEVYEENKGEDTIIIRAKLLDKLLRNKKLFLDANPIVGTMTGIPCGLYAYPEWNCAWIKDEMDMAKTCSLGTVVIPEEIKSLMMETYKNWKGRSVRDIADITYKDLYGQNPRNYIKAGMLYDVASNANGSGVVDYARILNEGARGVINDAEERMRNMTYNSGSYHKFAFLKAVKIVMEAFIAWANRYADLAEKTATEETNPKKKAELLEIAQVCRRVPEHPATNFREAVQSFWFTHLLVEIEQMDCANSPGRYGQYMYPFYKKDIEEGRITRAEVDILLRFQFVRHTEVGGYSGMAYQKGLSGHTGQTLAIGGLTADGRDASNDLEEDIMVAQAKLKSIQPSLALFWNPMMEISYLMKAVDVVRTGIGQPQFMNTNVAVQRSMIRFAHRGITLQDARDTVNFGCVATGVGSGKGSYSGGEDSINIAKFVELAMYNGWDPTTKKQLGPKTGEMEEFADIEEFYSAVYKQMAAGMKVQRLHSNLVDSVREHVTPGVFRSALHTGCIENASTEESGGHLYPQGVAISACGVDAGNALNTIKKLIYDEKILTPAQLKAALEADFVGYEDVQKMCLDAPKYGNGDAEADKYVQRVYADLSTLHGLYGPDYFGNPAHPDAYSLSFHDLYGAQMNAYPTGRKKGKAFTDGSVSAMPGTDKEGPTALVKSAAHAIDTTWYDSNHFNMKFLPSALEGAKGGRMLIDLLKTYFDEGGSHIQFNCVSRDTLLDARENPENYKDLVVRVAGFSAFFTRLDGGVQEEIIKRTEYK